MGLLISFIKILITLFRVIFFAFFLGEKLMKYPLLCGFSTYMPLMRENAFQKYCKKAILGLENLKIRVKLMM